MVTNLLLPLPSDGVVCARHQIEATAAAMVTGKVSGAEEEGRRSTAEEKGVPERTTKFLIYC